MPMDRFRTAGENALPMLGERQACKALVITPKDAAPLQQAPVQVNIMIHQVDET